MDHGFFVFQVEGFLVDPLVKARGQLQGRGSRRARHEDHELITGEADGQALFSGHLCEQTSHQHQRLIATLMAVGIVNRLEVIHIDHEQRQGVAVQGIPGNFVLEVAEEEATVGDTGQLVFKDQARGILADLFQRGDELFVLHPAYPASPTASTWQGSRPAPRWLRSRKTSDGAWR